MRATVATALALALLTTPGAVGAHGAVVNAWLVDMTTHVRTRLARTTTTATALTVPGVAGATYRFRIRAVDPADRAGSFGTVRATIVPYETGGSVTGPWTTVTGGSFYRARSGGPARAARR